MAVQLILSPDDAFFKDRPFDWDGRLFTTIADFETFLRDPAVLAQLRAWAIRVTAHHTWKPTVAGWMMNTGAANLKGLIRTWRDDNGWTTGPNMVIAPEGIYLASGIDGPGIHAGVCNGNGVGIEIVGNYDNTYWQEPIRSFVFGAFVALSRALGNTQQDVIEKKRVNGHRECLPNKSCPGNGIDLDKFRRDVAARMTITPQTDKTVIGVPPSITAEQFKKYAAQYHAPVPPGELDRIYLLSEWLEIDPAFLLAVWKQEAFVDDPVDEFPGIAVIGGSELQRQSRNPLNIVEKDSVRGTVTYNKRKWRKWSTWQLGLMDALLYLKEVHGAAGRTTVRQIIPVHAPASDGNNPDQFITNVFTRMDDMRKL